MLWTNDEFLQSSEGERGGGGARLLFSMSDSVR